MVARSVNARPDVRKLNAEFEQRVKEVYSHENITELGALAGTLTKLLSQYAPGAALELNFDEVIPPRITLPTAIASLVEDNFKSPIGYSGHGLQRALILALLQQISLTDLSPPAKEGEGDGEGEGEGEKVKTTHIPNLILGIEEPELYLHPSRSRFLSSVLDDLCQKPENAGDPRTQILFATHSPYFTELNRFDRIRLARKTPTEGSSVRQCKVTSYSKLSAATELARVSGKNADSFTGESFFAHASPVMNSIVNEGFFADVVVVVEGLTEAGMLWGIQQALKAKWNELGIVVVSAEGKTKIDRPVVAFRGLEIPTYFIFDGDSRQKDRKEEAATIERNKMYLRLANVALVDFPATQIEATWAVFENDLESEIKGAIGEAYFFEVRDKISQELGYDQPSIAVKNPEVSARIIKSDLDPEFRIS